MKKIDFLRRLYVLAAILLLTGTAFGQLTGTKTVPGDYATIAIAITDLNAQGVGAGGVIFNVAAGTTETFASPTAGLITATGTSANPIVFQKSGAGANPVITAATPGVSTTVDGIIVIRGGDYITFDGIDLTENTSNTTATMQMEWGYALVKTSATDGAQYNEIKNCSVTLNKTNIATVGVYSGNHTDANTTALTVTDVLGANSYNKVNGNTVTNSFTNISFNGSSTEAYFDQNNEIGVTTGNSLSNFGGSSSSYSIYIRYNNNFKIANNAIINSGTTGTLRGMYLAGTINASGDIYNNHIQLSSSATSSQLNAIESAITGNGTLNIHDNIIHDFTYTSSTSGIVYLIYQNGGVANLNIYDNSLTDNSSAGTGTFGLIYTTSTVTTASIYGNTISGNSKTGASGTMYCIRASTGTISVHDNIITDNTVPTTSGTSAASIYGYYNFGSPLIEGIYNNQINGLSIGGTSSGALTIYGIYSNTTATAVKNIYSNNVNNLNVTTGNGTIYGIYQALGAPTNLYKNKIYNLSSSGTGGTTYGMYISSGSTNNIYNNFISDIKAPAATGANAVSGLYISGGTTANVFYNSIYLNTSSTGATFGSTGIYKSSTTTGDFRNNIVVNVSTPGATSGNTVAYRWSGTYDAAYYASTSNNNCFYAGVPAANTLIFFDGTNSDQTIADYKTRVSGRDGVSISENPPFVSASDLHLQTTIATQCESGGVVVSAPFAVTTDFDEETRNASTPDIGADEGAFTPSDLTAPSISYTALSNTSSTSARSLAVTITDFSGVGSGANQPVLYWKINAAASYTGPVAPSSIAGSVYTYDFGDGVVAADVVSYFVVAQDNASTPNVGSYPSGATVTANPPVATAGPATPSSYTILGYISGIKTVGVGGDFATLTAAVNALNNNELNGALVFQLIDADYSTSETFPLIINSNTGSSVVNTVTIKPADGVVSAITGSVASDAVIKINGASYIIIDGSNTVDGTTRDLTIKNLSTTAPKVILFGSLGTNPISNITLENCNIVNGANTSSALVVTSYTGTAGYFNNISILNNSVQTAYIGIYCNSALAPSNGNGLVISGNTLNASGGNSIRLVGIYVQGVDGATVSNNTIGYFATANAESPKGIWFATGTVNSTINSNTLNSIYANNTGSYSSSAIYITNGAANSNINVTNNTISDISVAGSSVSYGIYIGSAISGVNISKNTISNIKNTNSGGYSAIGIALASSLTTANTTVSNNRISDVTGYGWTSTTTDNGYGINILSGGGYNLYYNTISLSANQSIGTPACLIINSTVSTAGSLDIRNNIFSISSTVGDRYAIICNTTSATFSNLDYNDYISAGTNLGYFEAADVLDLAAWQTATGKDANSKSIAPYFVSATDLHLISQANCQLSDLGTPISGITTDFDGDTRSESTPDMGADEFDSSPITANAGSDDVSCDGTYTLDGNTVSPATGTWTASQAVTFSDATLNTCGLSDLLVGISTLTWTAVYGTCSTSDDVSINNNPISVTADAGADDFECGTTSAILGNDPGANTGTWSSAVVGVSFDNESAFSTNVNDLPLGASTLTWTISNGVCSTFDDVVITNASVTVAANAGADDFECGPVSAINANDPGANTGTWSSAVVGVSFDNESAFSTNVNDLPLGASTLTWTISNGVCSTFDDVVITNASVTSVAGTTQNLCDATSTSLEGNDPSLIINGLTNEGAWELASGSAIFTNQTGFNTEVTNLSEGENTLTWTVSNTYCNAQSDLSIWVAFSPTVNVQPIALQELALGATATMTFDVSGTDLNYQWRKGGSDLVDGGTIAGSQTATLTITGVLAGDAGSYDCVVTNSCNTVTSNASVLSIISSVDNHSAKKISIYPNPTSGLFTVASESLYKLTVIDITGKVICAKDLNNNTNTVDLSNYPSGIYNLILTNSTETHNFRLIKK